MDHPWFLGTGFGRYLAGLTGPRYPRRRRTENGRSDLSETAGFHYGRPPRQSRSARPPSGKPHRPPSGRTTAPPRYHRPANGRLRHTHPGGANATANPIPGPAPAKSRPITLFLPKISANGISLLYSAFHT